VLASVCLGISFDNVLIYTPSVHKYKMLYLCEANVSREVLMCIFK
jgi:hypothetical protein